MLESMVEHEHPTRAEVTDVANAVLDGTDAVMLSAESAVGRHPASAVRILHRVLAATEAEYATRIAAARLQADSAGTEQALAFAACQLAGRLGAKAIVTRVSNHVVPSAIARFRPVTPIIALSTSHALCSSLLMVRGVSPLHTHEADNGQPDISHARDWLLDLMLARPGDLAVVVSQSNDGIGTPDTLQVVTLPT
jgi:pyruvate kinase